MTKLPIHSTLLSQAATAKLKPLGFQQRGRSRLWFADYGWWLVLVEFQPSSWSRGTYLNVAAHWLWHDKAYWSFDVGSREGRFVPYQSDEQFLTEANRLCDLAAVKATGFRKRFASVKRVANFLVDHCRPDNHWHLYNAGVACGLALRTKRAMRYFQDLSALSVDNEWQQQLHGAAQELLLEVQDEVAFRSRILGTISAARARLRLPTKTVSLQS